MNNVSVESLPFSEAVSRYGEAWESIIAANRSNPSMLPGWLLAAAEAFGKTIDVFAATRNDELIGVIPYFREKRSFLGIPTQYVCMATNLAAHHPELAAKEGESGAVLERFAEYAFQTGGDCISAVQLLKPSASFDAFAQVADIRGYRLEGFTGDASPYLVFGGTWQDILQGKAKKFRYKVRKRQNLLDEGSNVQNRWIDDVDELLAIIFQIEKNSWKVASHMDIESSDTEQQHYRYLLPYMKKKNLLSANVVYIDEEPAAYNLCYLWGNGVGQIKTSFDSRFQDLSPGAMVIEVGLREYIDKGFEEFDFLGDVMKHKLAWSKELRHHESVFLYDNSLKMKTVFQLKQLKQKLMSKTQEPK